MKEITLGQLLQYYDPEKVPADRIQVVEWNQDIDHADELTINSEFLKPFTDRPVMAMHCTESHLDKRPILRILIDTIV